MSSGVSPVEITASRAIINAADGNGVTVGVTEVVGVTVGVTVGVAVCVGVLVGVGVGTGYARYIARIRPLLPTAAAVYVPDDHATEFHTYVLGADSTVQVVPSGEVMIDIEPPALSPTAMNRPTSFAHVTSFHAIASAVAFGAFDHDVPLVEVMMRFVPLDATATKRDSVGDHVTLVHTELAVTPATPVQLTVLGSDE